MKRESMTRREFLRRGLVGLSAVAVWRPGRRSVQRISGDEKGRLEDAEIRSDLSQEQVAATPHSSVSPSIVSPSAGSLVLSVHEYATVAAMATLIVPTDHDPGAKEADVAGYIDRLVSGNGVKRQEYTDGVRWMDEASGNLFGRGRSFVDLSPQEQLQVLQAAEATLDMRLRPVTSFFGRAWRKVQKTYDDLFGLGGGAKFFRFVREDTMAGFYTNPLSWSMLGYIGPPQPRGYPHHDDCPPQARR
jgi:gluconate 2-dehydrogenase gamma chain